MAYENPENNMLNGAQLFHGVGINSLYIQVVKKKKIRIWYLDYSELCL